MTDNPVKDAARRRAKRNREDRKTIDSYKRTVREVEEIAHRGREVVATGQTIAKAVLRRRSVPLTRLKKARRFNVWEATAADEIIHAHSILSGIVNVRDPDLGIGGGTIRPESADSKIVRYIDSLDKFNEWKTDLNHTNAFHAVMDILISEKSLEQAEREHRWRTGTAFRHLRDGLRHFAALRGNVPRGEKWRLPVGGK